MLVTVVGSTGVLGRRVVEQLLDEGHTVRALARSRQAADRLPSGTAVVGDVWDEGFLRVCLAGADAAMMLATAIPDGLGAARLRAWRMNDRVRSELAPMVSRIAGESGVRTLVQESVLFVYADSAEHWVTESSAVDPARQAQSCLVAEHAARSFQVREGQDRRAVVLRFALFGSPDSRLSRQAWRAATKGRVPVFGDLHGYTTYVHIRDAAAAAVHALDLPGGTYNVGAQPCTQAEWLAALSELVGRPVEAPPGPVRTLAPRIAPVLGALSRSIRLDSSALGSTGWEPQYPTVRDVWSAVGSGAG